MQGKLKNKTIILLALVIILTLAACQPAKPTQDPQAVFTQAAMTVQVAMTQTAAAKPSATSTPTIAPTNTIAPTVPPTTPPPAASPVNVGAATATTSPDRGVWVSQNPGDGATLDPGQNFNLTWQFKNTGTTTWTTAYMLRYYLNEPVLRLGAPDQNISKEVKPGETIDLTLNATAPSAPGAYETFWVLTNKDGVNFARMTFNFTVGQPLTPSPTDEAVPTATAPDIPTATMPDATPTP